MAVRLYGVPLSQPFRSVAWACLMKRVPFEIEMIIPGSKDKMGGRSAQPKNACTVPPPCTFLSVFFCARSEAYLAKNPLGTIPFVEDGPVAVAESADPISNRVLKPGHAHSTIVGQCAPLGLRPRSNHSLQGSGDPPAPRDQARVGSLSDRCHTASPNRFFNALAPQWHKTTYTRVYAAVHSARSRRKHV